ncbi:hypothetical protein ACBJ59_55405 [Nonomuraea sp. MTCD27]|uniref:hypothetical protein n=1 Tax=Nonomuraea sp. MTCD27 TaxID=1676747 RepID=UPI0035C26B5E
MEFLVGVLILLVLVDLLLTFGVIRRLREHTTRLATLRDGLEGPRPGLRPGAPVGAFPATATTRGATFSPAALRNGTGIVAFHSLGCHSCEEDVSALAGRMAEAAGRGWSGHAVLAGSAGDVASDPHVAELADRIGEAGEVIVEAFQGPLQTAFDVSVYPTYFVVEGGRVAAVSHRAADLPTTAETVPG